MRVLLVEDDSITAEFVVKGLREAGFTVDHAATGEEGREYALAGKYDVAVFDRMLPGMDGLAVISEMRGRGIETPVLILSAKQTVDDKVTGLQAGGDDYLTKPFHFSELLARVQALVRRSSNAPAENIIQVADLTLDRFTREVKRAGDSIELQSKEFALLEYMMANTGRVITKTMILENLWDFTFDPQTNVVEVLIHRLRTKVDKPYESKLIRTIRGSGYVLGEKN